MVPPDAAIDKLLHPVATSPESVTLEIFEVRIPGDQDQQAEAIWQQIDEQCFDADLRNRLLANGLRAGILGGTPPDELSNLLGLKSEMPEESGERIIAPNAAVPRVRRRVVQVNRLEPRTIQASDLHEEAEVLLNENGRISGRTFHPVEGRYELWAEAVPGQRVAVRLAPELHHGDLANRYSGTDQGAYLIIPSRERLAFADLGMKAELSPGELLVVGCLPEAKATLGGLLHTVASQGRNERQFILIRVLEAPASEILGE
jgi:hypothetical protein